MSENVLIISSSLRTGSNSHILAEAFARGAAEAGYTVEIISLRDKTIGFCRGCLACQSTQQCVIHDDAMEITAKMEQADVLVFATPIYYYEMSGQMKTILDRANPLFTKDYKFRDIYLLTSAAEDEDHTWSKAACGLEGWIECFPKAHMAGVIFAGGVTSPAEAAGHPAVEKAYLAGRQLGQ